MKIVLLDQKTLGDDLDVTSELSQLGSINIYPETAPHQTIERLENADIAITNKVIINKNVIDKCSSLKLICVTATGTNNIDLEYAAQKNIKVNNVAGYSTNSVAQHTFATLLSITNNIEYYKAYVAQKKYSNQSMFTHLDKSIPELSSMTLGIIGMGNIGQKVADIAQAFGMSVVYYSTSGKNKEQSYPSLELKELLQRSDVVSIHSPLSEQTFNLLNEENLKFCKPNAIILNMGRGGIINEKALATALKEDIIFSAALDVFQSEPLSINSPLLSEAVATKMVMTPHIAWASFQARERLWGLTIDNIKNFINA